MFIERLIAVAGLLPSSKLIYFPALKMHIQVCHPFGSVIASIKIVAMTGRLMQDLRF
jgi:hypothetical protein